MLPAFQQINVIYEFSCHYDSRYVCRTSQRLQDRIKQHVPKSIRTGQSSQDRAVLNRSCKSTDHEPSCDSAIGQHLLTNQSCAQHCSDNKFAIFAKGRSAFHLSALEATFIKVSQPILCRQNRICLRFENHALALLFLIGRPFVQLEAHFSRSLFDVLARYIRFLSSILIIVTIPLTSVRQKASKI